MFLKSIIYSLVILGVSAPIGFAQTPTNELDEVVATGTIRGGDPAMSAFFNGDFETAEIEFEKNFRKIKRNEMVLKDSVAATRGNAALSDVRAGTPDVGGQGGAVSARGRTQVNLSSLTLNVRKKGEGVLSGNDPGFQLYMAGLSQIQLKKYDAAKDSLRRAIVMNKRIYDAHMRLGVLYLRDGEIAKARKQYKKLEQADRRCKNICDGKDDIQLGLQVLGGALRQS